MIIGITGTDGAGKGTVVDYLLKKGYTHYHARTLFLKEIEKCGWPNDRNHLRLVANNLRKEHGNEFIAKLFMERAKEEGVENAVIDSLRALEEAEYLKTHGGILLAVDADQKLRYERVQKRRSETDQVTFEEFKAHEELEMNDPDPHGMQKAKVIEMADYVIRNEGTFEELEEQIEKLITKLS